MSHVTSDPIHRSICRSTSATNFDMFFIRESSHCIDIATRNMSYNSVMARHNTEKYAGWAKNGPL